MERVKNILSYICPIIVETTKGEVTPYLEVLKSKGKYHLNSSYVNYSYGSLHTVFEKAFEKTQINNYSFRNILVLGMGAGSVISLLRNKYRIEAPITAIEKDGVVIDLAKKYFNINNFQNLNIVHDDAFQFVAKSQNKYDLIIIDLSIESIVPEKFASLEFLANLQKISAESSCFFYNKMTDEQKNQNEAIQLLSDFQQFFPGTHIIKINRQGWENSLFYCNSISKKNIAINYAPKPSKQLFNPNLQQPAFG